MDIPEGDRTILRKLAAEVAEIASLPTHKVKAGMWTGLNRLQSGRPLVLIDEAPWHEMNVDDELTIRTRDKWSREIEGALRRTIYQWRHMPADMTVCANLWSPLAIRNSGYGIERKVNASGGGEHGQKGSDDYIPVIRDLADVEKIKMPQITHDEQAGEENYQRMVDVFGDIMPVKKRGVSSFWMAPWDRLVTWYGVTELMVDMIARPELVHAAIDRHTAARQSELDQYEKLNVISPNNCGQRVGSGGLGWTDQLPQDDFDGGHVRLMDVWGNSTAQIFSEVSPAMHDEFALQYELRFLKRFGLNCYGCCEPLHKKIDIIRQIPRLRRISMSPFVDVAEGAERIGTDYVFSLKPNPSILAMDAWNPDLARKELHEAMEKARGCHVEIIMKDITTVRNEPRRLWEWETIAMEVAEQFAP